MKTNRKPLKDDLKGPAFLAPIFRTVNQMAKMINGFSLLSGGDVILDPEGIMIRLKDAPILNLGDMWELFQAVEDTPGLVMSMRPGLLVHTATTTLFPVQTFVSYTPAAVADDATTEFWLKVTVAKSGYQAYFDVWHVSDWAVEKGAAVPADTLDLSTETAGDLHFPIGTVIAADGEITSITQIRAAMPVVVVFPLSVALFDGVCPEPPPPEE